MYKAKINGKFEFEIARGKDGWSLDGMPVQLDISALREGRLSVINGHTHFEVEVVKIDRQAKTASLKVNNNLYTVEITDRLDQLLQQMGMAQGSSGKLNELKSPMPGLVLNVSVAEGQQVQKGDPLLVLEAMKMENVIKSPGEGTVKHIAVKPGAAVEKNALLIRFE